MTWQPETEEKTTVLTLTPEVELHLGSDQGPTTSPNEGIVKMDNEVWLRDFSEEVITPTLSHLAPSSSLFLDSTKSFKNYELIISSTCIDCIIITFILSRFVLLPSPPSPPSQLRQSSKPAVSGCLQPCSVSVETLL